MVFASLCVVCVCKYIVSVVYVSLCICENVVCDECQREYVIRECGVCVSVSVSVVCVVHM